MANLQQVEKALIEINDATFQQLCDSYLFHSEDDYPGLNRSGSQKAKKKTKKGTPDTFWILPSGKYVFAEYTTRNKKDNKPAFLKKLSEDIKKCIDKKKTGVDPSLIQKIIVCFNSEITTRESQALKKIVNKHRIDLVFKSLDTLAQDIYGRYQHLAPQFLELQIDTGQVLPPETFIAEYSSNQALTTPLDNKFLFRTNELMAIQNDLTASDILILAGAPGVGKSKLALETLFNWKKNHSEYELFCLSNKYVNIFEDLHTHLKIGKNYVVLIDDANRQSQNLLTILSTLKSRRKGKIKLVITVRDYALDYIKKHCHEFNYSLHTIQLFTDVEIEEILKSDDFKITNNLYIRRIQEVSKGNPRIAIMIARLAIAKQNLDSLHDLADFYDSYFMSFIKDDELFNSIDLQKALGIVSFFYSIDKSDKDAYKKLLETFELDNHKFIESLTKLERLELVESSADNTVIRIADQVLSNYFFFKSFIKDKILNFEALLNRYFDSHRNRFSDTIIPTQRDFGYTKVIEPIENLIIEYFTRIQNDDKKSFLFLNTFWFCIPDQSLSFLHEKISQLQELPNAKFIIDKNDKNHYHSDDPILKALIGFYFQNSPLVVSGLELSFDYVSRKPELYQEFYKTIIGSFTFSYEDERYGFYRQAKLIDLLIEQCKEKVPIYLAMFLDLIPEFLKTHFTVHGSSWKRDTMTFYNYPLPADEFIKKIRKKIWQQLSKTFNYDETKTSNVINEYLKPGRDKVKSLLEFDLPFLLNLIDKKFQPTSFKHCYYVQELIRQYKRLEISHPIFNTLKGKFYSKEYKIYKIIDPGILRGKEDHEYQQLDYDKFERLKEIEIKYKLYFNTVDQFRDFYRTFVLIATDPHIQTWNFNTSLDVVINETYQKDPELAYSSLTFIQQELNKTSFTPFQIFRSVAANGKDQIEKCIETISIREYPFKSHWIFSFFNLLSEKDITKEHYQILMSTFQSANYYFVWDFTLLPKFQKFNDKIHIDVMKMFIEKAEAGIMARLDFQFFETSSEYFGNDLAVLKKAYFLCEKFDQNFDHNGDDLLTILKMDTNFIMEYLEHYVKPDHSLYVSEFDHLSCIWKIENIEPILKNILGFFAKKNVYFFREEFANAFFRNLSPDSKIKAETFLKGYLKTSNRNLKKVNITLDIFRNCFPDKYAEMVAYFIQLNTTIENFKKLKLLNSYFMSSGHTIWEDVRAAELENIMIEVNKLPNSHRYYKHKAYLKNWISNEKRNAEHQRRRKFMNDQW
jgi:hypothetical protein